MTGHCSGGRRGRSRRVHLVSSIKWFPTINHEHVDDQLDNELNLTLNQAQKREVRAALSNTFGFGGHNASVVFKAYQVAFGEALLGPHNPDKDIRTLVSRFGLRVRQRKAYDEALTHSSMLDGDKTGLKSNERLEFLGDVV